MKNTFATSSQLGISFDVVLLGAVRQHVAPRSCRDHETGDAARVFARHGEMTDEDLREQIEMAAEEYDQMAVNSEALHKKSGGASDRSLDLLLPCPSENQLTCPSENQLTRDLYSEQAAKARRVHGGDGGLSDHFLEMAERHVREGEQRVLRQKD